MEQQVAFWYNINSIEHISEVTLVHLPLCIFLKLV